MPECEARLFQNSEMAASKVASRRTHEIELQNASSIYYFSINSALQSECSVLTGFRLHNFSIQIPRRLPINLPHGYMHAEAKTNRRRRRSGPMNELKALSIDYSGPVGVVRSQLQNARFTYFCARFSRQTIGRVSASTRSPCFAFALFVCLCD